MSPPDAALAYSRAEIASALVDPAVLRVVWRAARDVRMRQAFQAARRDGARVDEIVEVLCGPFSVQRISHRRDSAVTPVPGQTGSLTGRP